MRALLLAPLALTLIAVPARADDAAVLRVMEESGLMGSWAVDCDASPSMDTPWEVIAVGDDGLVRAINDGGEYRSTYVIVDARREGANDVAMTAREEREDGAYGEPLSLVYRVEARRQKTWTSTTSDGVELVTGGYFPSGDENPWYARCGGGPTA